MTDPSFNTTPYNPDRLVAGHHQLVTRVVTLTDNQSIGALTRGTVLGEVSGTYAAVHQTGSYGAATAKAILAEDADPSGGDVEAMIYVAGEFNQDEILLNGTVVTADVIERLQENSVYLKAPVPA